MLPSLNKIIIIIIKLLLLYYYTRIHVKLTLWKNDEYQQQGIPYFITMFSNVVSIRKYPCEEGNESKT